MATQVYRDRIVTERVWTDSPEWTLPTAAQVLARGQHRTTGRQTRLVEVEGSPAIVAAALRVIQENSRYFEPHHRGRR